MTAFLDTNVILRFLTADRSLKYRDLYDFFKAIEEGHRQVELKLIVLFQVLFVLKSYYKVPKPLICDNIFALLSFKGLRISEKRIVIRMIELWRSKNTDIVDCYLIACLEFKPGDSLYNYDNGLDRHGVTHQVP